MKEIFSKEFSPDYRFVVDAAFNRKPGRLPLYEHQINFEFIEKIIGENIEPASADSDELLCSYQRLCQFWKGMTYDTISFEAQICPILPDHGAIYGGRQGPIQNRDDFDKYPFAEIPEIFWEHWTPHLNALEKALPPGMKAIGGCGYGVFEISEDLVGYEPLCVMMYDDPELFRDLYLKIGELMELLWTQLLPRYGELFAVCRMGDDLGFKNSTLLAPATIDEHIVPQYQKIISRVHQSGKPFLFHSCGNIFPVMDSIISAGIDAKHSNEDIIAPFERWIECYGDQIALFGGVDVNILCLNDPDTVFDMVVEKAKKFRSMSQGFAIGSGNSIPEYVPVEGYLAMIKAAWEIRKNQL
ncbi:MAG: uroporphyrinogen decarboxylase family protein [bacterium]|nr:uroporphyrinogen decarboxylase family protein [bacterium]